MKLLLLLTCLLLHLVAGSRYAEPHPNIPLGSCPRGCVCENSFCTYLSKSSGGEEEKRRRESNKVKCLGVQVVCDKGDSRLPLDGMPSNVTGVLIQNYDINVLDLNGFYVFPKLNDVIVTDSNVTQVTLTKILKNVKRLVLTNNRLRALPRRGLARMKTLERLNLRNNSITSLRGIRFPRKLDIVDVRENEIAQLTGGSFRGGKMLRVIKLNDNKIRSIHLNAFSNTPNIEVLDMENNRLERLNRGMFSKLTRCWYLNLRKNRIKNMHKFAFLMFGSRSNARNQIDLRDNLVRFLSVDLLTPLIERPDAYEVNFAGNPVFCDCNLLNLREDAGRMLTDQGHITCAGPPDNMGRIVLRLKFEDCCF